MTIIIFLFTLLFAGLSIVPLMSASTDEELHAGGAD